MTQLEMFATQAISWKCRKSLGIALELCISSKIEMSRKHLISGEGAFVGHLQWCTDAYCCHGNFGINCPHTHTHNILVHIFQPPVSNHPKCADLGVAYAGAGSFQEDILIHLLLLRKRISFRQFLSSDVCGSTFLLKVLHIFSE